MKYSILIVGNNKVITEEIFTHMWEDFECLTASNRFEDMMNHFKYYTPDALVYCLYKESKSNMKQVISVKEKLQEENIPLIVIGSQEDCSEFTAFAPNASHLVLEKPLSIQIIAERMLKFLNQKRKAEEMERMEQERLMQELRKKEEELRQAEEERLAEETKKGRKHILVVDDDSLMLKLIKEHLHEDYDVATAISGKVAMKFLGKKSTDLILLDYEMPEENGPAVLEKLHANDATKNIPVVFLTGISEKEKIQKALVLKPQGYLLKPIDREKLIETIKKLIG